jgi:glycosyltransferase involved in cell wall biosynthesis
MSGAAGSDSLRVTIVHLGRRGGLGERRRVEAWRVLLEDVGATVAEIPLMQRHRRGLRPPSSSDLVALLRRRSVIETLAWDARGTAADLRRTEPDGTIFVTARAYHPRLHGIAGTEVLDFVDRMSSAYGDRADVVRNPLHKVGFRVLSWSHRGFERGTRRAPARRVAAGHGDASTLGAVWLPIPIRAMSGTASQQADHDLVFFGTLGYPPNIAAVRRLARLWPALQARRPGLSLLLAGARPTQEVRATAIAQGWELNESFEDVSEVCSRARVAVVPLEHASGIQIKVLEAAAAGLPQVVSPPALRGFAPGFPAIVAEDDAAFVNGVLRLLDDDDLRRGLAKAANDHVREHYSFERWRPVVADLLRIEQPAPVAPRSGEGTPSSDTLAGFAPSPREPASRRFAS